MKNSIDLKNIMMQAWMFVRTTGMTMSEALKLAWRNFKLKVAMKHRIVKFWFVKIDGTVRQAYGTLIDRMLPPTKGTGRNENPTIQTYYDTEKQAYRCFKVANLIRYEQ